MCWYSLRGYNSNNVNYIVAVTLMILKIISYMITYLIFCEHLKNVHHPVAIFLAKNNLKIKA